MRYYVYVLYSATLNKFYVGQTEDIDRRLEYHNNPIESRKFTAKGRPWELKLVIECESRGHAIALERFIKRMKSQAFIRKLILDENLRNDILLKTGKSG